MHGVRFDTSNLTAAAVFFFQHETIAFSCRAHSIQEVVRLQLVINSPSTLHHELAHSCLLLVAPSCHCLPFRVSEYVLTSSGLCFG